MPASPRRSLPVGSHISEGEILRSCDIKHCAKLTRILQTSVRMVKNKDDSLHFFSTAKLSGSHYVPCKVSCLQTRCVPKHLCDVTFRSLVMCVGHPSSTRVAAQSSRIPEHSNSKTTRFLLTSNLQLISSIASGMSHDCLLTRVALIYY